MSGSVNLSQSLHQKFLRQNNVTLRAMFSVCASLHQHEMRKNFGRKFVPPSGHDAIQRPYDFEYYARKPRYGILWAKKMRDFNAFLASQSVSHIIQNVDKFSFPFPLGDDIKNWVILILDFQVPHSTEDTNFG